MKKIIVALVSLMLFAVPAMAEMKIAYVDLQKALNLSMAGVAAKNEIAAQVKKYEDEFKAKQDDLQKMKDELEKQAVLLSDSAKAQKEREFQQNIKELQRFQKDVKEELQQRDADATKKILNRLFEILQTLGKDGGYQMILEKNEGAVIYADKSVDLTDELIKAFDAAQ
ncbi:periplasmic chaperone for outer membrane proteins Skp [Malonomonas rubra DSM 5091]|uniref:Periplasmic chaperone for outer membrane proteins Skp n=1 Tax=Malonomonas rubra DSM 5091 TaxID=1122189 RepID=A0A1M6C8Z0_MALRU|nr:OmpH family outer membrane protein [Malonomonas rubra]SHI57497.1 periplasmic chaperone for outer membrane proteins Skp [Malonomonas rubra DSM 5091]